MKKASLPYLLLVLLSGVAALNYQIFVFPNRFAPAGVDGICTMVQYLTGTDMGYLALAVNAPLLILGFLTVERGFIIKSAIYTLSFSSFTLFFGQLDLSRFLYHTDTGTSIVLAPVAAGVIRGLLYAATLKAGGSGGGMDIVAAIFKHYRPHYNLMSIIFTLNVFVAIGAYFVYGFEPEPVICSILYSFLASAVSRSIETGKKESIRFEIVTEDALRLCHEISEELGLASTVIEARGGYSGSDKKMVICVSDKESVPRLEKLLARFSVSIVFENTIITSERIRKYERGRP